MSSARSSTSDPTSPARQAKTAAFFDVDNTIIRGASAFQLARGLHRRGMLAWHDIMHFAWMQARYMARGENLRDMHMVREKGLRAIRGRSVAEIMAVGEQVYDEVLTHRVFPGAKTLIDSHLAAGHEVWILTASPVEIGSLIAHHMGATGALATIAEHENGFYTGRLIGDLLHGAAKATAAQELADRENIDLAASFAYGDSSNDIAILSLVGHPCGINPDLRLRRYCATHGWPTRDFRCHRKAVRHSLRAASAVGVIWATGAAFNFLRRRRR